MSIIHNHFQNKYLTLPQPRHAVFSSVPSSSRTIAICCGYVVSVQQRKMQFYKSGVPNFIWKIMFLFFQFSLIITDILGIYVIYLIQLSFKVQLSWTLKQHSPSPAFEVTDPMKFTFACCMFSKGRVCFDWKQTSKSIPKIAILCNVVLFNCHYVNQDAYKFTDLPKSTRPQLFPRIQFRVPFEWSLLRDHRLELQGPSGSAKHFRRDTHTDKSPTSCGETACWFWGMPFQAATNSHPSNVRPLVQQWQSCKRSNECQEPQGKMNVIILTHTPCHWITSKMMHFFWGHSSYFCSLIIESPIYLNPLFKRSRGYLVEMFVIERGRSIFRFVKCTKGLSPHGSQLTRPTQASPNQSPLLSVRIRGVCYIKGLQVII